MLRKYFKFYFFGGLLIAAVLVWLAIFSLQGSGLLEVNFFDVGQGDAIFIETPEKFQVLIDGGPDNKILEKLGEEMPFWDRTIDLVILTHPDPDHLNGIIEVLKKYKVGKIMYTGIVPEYLKEINLDIVDKEKTEEIIAVAGQKINLNRNIHVDILYPFEDISGQKFTDFNDTSIVCQLIYGKTSFMFTGDAPKSVEYQLLARQANLDSNILKVAHHGSKTSMSDYFLNVVSPEIAVIQVGKDNKFGHPHQEVLDILEKQNVRILRADIIGDIKITSDGVKYKTKK